MSENACGWCDGRGYLVGGNNPRCGSCEGTGKADHFHTKDKIAELLAVCEKTVAYLEKVSSDPDTYHAEIMQPLRAIIEKVRRK